MADAVVLPGAHFGPAAGLLMYAAAVAERRGGSVHRHSWEGRPAEVFQPEAETWVCGQAAPVVDGSAGRPLLIGKSLGSYAARLAADRELPAVWITPILTVPWVVEALGRARAPFLLVGGTGDAWWDGSRARRLTPHVLEVDGANHGMSVPGPVTESIAVLGRMVTAIDEFLDAIGWPPAGDPDVT